MPSPKEETESGTAKAETASTVEFIEALTTAKEKLKKEEEKKEKKVEKKAKPKKKKEKVKEKEIRKKLAEISVEKEAAKPPTKAAKAPVKPIPPELVPPIYRRSLPRLPAPPKVTAEWPLQPPKALARPPEEEAAAPPVAPTPTPFPLAVKPEKARPRPVIVKPTAAPVVAPAPTAAPAPTLDLGKLNSLVADETITTIQCDGANIPIKITKERRVEELALVLSEEEIKSIIRAFSEASQQAVTEPMFKVSIGILTISATISAFAGCKFVIARS